MTHVIFSFAHPLPDGSFLLNGDRALNNLKKMVSLAHQHDTKAILAVGGWFHIWGGESYPYFKQAIMNPASRAKLIQELFSITERENLDGIDIDFEHPRSTEEAQSLATFTKELSESLHSKNKEVSIAVYAKVHSSSGTEVTSVVYDSSMFEQVDHVNIMAYDGQWDGGYNAAHLSPYSYAENIVNYWSELFNAHQLDKEKLVLGVPFYAQPEKPDHKQISYADIIENNPANAVNDTVQINGITYYYNGESTVEKKTQLALDHGFGGMMLWEAGHDASGEYSMTSTIAEVLNAQYVLK
ncbi:glycosyl hydrolase family 18 protein [Bacillus benzoevorans]|uniref:chitinase n=1 Tax=Bacillus benzoevorans TaxID=1456 RepID=A0A7X0HQW5_9BACI|nr:glycosyl hydrolase family 18 protein [Bacillus benzoevorans]MBB6445283.1 GH18 family chitinase [Bacillus benzoevorans]